jgi:arsenate reductase
VNVLFVCIQNAGRSQIASAIFERAAAGTHAARSAGSDPAEQVHPEVVEVMRDSTSTSPGASPASWAAPTRSGPM